MDTYPVAQRVRCYLSETDTIGHQPAHKKIVALLRREGASGVTVLRGVEGFGAHGHIHTAAIVDIDPPLPMVIEWIDSPERVARILPRLQEMVKGLVTIEETHIAKMPPRALRNVPAGLLVRDVMTAAAEADTAGPDTSVRDIITLLLTKHRTAIPVLYDGHRVIGIITSRDLIQRAGLPLRLELLRSLHEARDPAVSERLSDLQGEGQTASSIMTRDVVTTGPNVRLVDAARLMLAQHLKRLPVVDRDGRFVGVVSRYDVLKSAADALGATQEGEATSASPASDHPMLADFIKRDIPTLAPEAALPEVLDAVMATRLHRAMVVDDECRPLGIVIDTDLLQRVTPAAHSRLFSTLIHRGRPAGGSEREELQRTTGQYARDVMRPASEMVIVTEDTDIAAAIEQSLGRRVEIVTVVDRAGRLVGMIYRADLLAMLAATA